MSQDFVIGTFVREEKNRFLCTVSVEGVDEECYIPSSCRLGNFLELAGKEILLRENQNKNARTRLAVYALKLNRNYLILKTVEANEIINNSIKGRRFSYLGKRAKVEKECTIGGYKADLYLPQTRTIIEIKAIITTRKEAIFPTVYSERAIEQLEKVKELLSEGINFVYIFMSLNPYVKKVTLSNDIKQIDYRKLFVECVKKGMIYKAYTSKLIDGKPVLYKEVQIDFNE